jgi:hypothetical protein
MSFQKVKILACSIAPQNADTAFRIEECAVWLDRLRCLPKVPALVSFSAVIPQGFEARFFC